MDNYNTQHTKHLHINFAKNAYNATNYKDEFAQMTTWLERKEKVLHHMKHIEQHLKPYHQQHPQQPLPNLQPPVS